MDQAEEDGAQGPGERRYWPRFLIEGKSKLLAIVGGRRFLCTLVNLSVSGATFRFDEAPPQHASITVEHPQFGRLTGDCVWQDAKHVGVRFDECLLQDQE